MKFTIKRDILLTNLNYVSKAISTKTLIPILSGIKFELTEDGLILSASDTNISIQAFIEKKLFDKIDKLGKIVIGGKYIVEIIRKLPDDLINIEVSDNYKMLIQTINSEFNLNGINPNEFPNLDIEISNNPLLINSLSLKIAFHQTLFATSQNESRPLLTGVNLKIDNNSLEVIATDSYRLARKQLDIDYTLSNINIVIPAKNLIELTKILEEDNENVKIHFFDNKILFVYKNIMFLSRLLNGSYPTTSSVIPNDFRIQLELNTNNFFNMIDRASLLSTDKERNTIKLSLNSNEMIISSNSPEIGYVEEKMKVDSNDEIIISFSAKYMLDAIKSFNDDKIVLCMNEGIKPIIIKSKKDNTLIQLVLPIKTY